MYENYTYENILKTITNRILEADPTIDIREGSAMWYAIAPVAVELAIAYTNIESLSGESFVGTATRDGIYRACDDIGLNTEQFDATASVFHGHFNAEVSIGSRWACGDYIFVVSSKVGMVTIDDVEYHQYNLICETLGSHTRHTNGNLRPITDYGSNQIRVAVLDECVITGQDEVSDSDVKSSYFEYVANKSEGGNIAQYKQWLNEFDGVGAYKVIPAWNGLNTVKAVILDETNQSPTNELIASVQSYLDPNSEGLGEGKAPIGAIVTVEGGTNAYINVKARLTLSSANADISDINVNLSKYFRDIAFHKTVVNIYEVASIILASPSVSDVNDVQIGRWVSDGTTVSYTASNITLGEYETPVLHEFING
jgi:uncharacterized phage protein gp47/JayE